LNEEKLLRAVAAGDEQAIGAVIDRYARLLWSVAGAALCGASAQDVEECVADAFVCLWQHPERFDPARGDLKTYLTVVARSRALDRRRELLRRGELPLDEAALPEGASAQEALLAREDGRALAEAVRALGEPEREIVVRRWYYGQKPREIALALGLPVKAVENRLYRARQRLRAALSE